MSCHTKFKNAETALRAASQARRELFELTGTNDVPMSVMNVSSSAGDNAADTVGWDRRYGSDGRHTDEFIDMWYESVRSILCCSDTEEEARTWFESHGVRY